MRLHMIKALVILNNTVNPYIHHNRTRSKQRPLREHIPSIHTLKQPRRLLLRHRQLCMVKIRVQFLQFPARIRLCTATSKRHQLNISNNPSSHIHIHLLYKPTTKMSVLMGYRSPLNIPANNQNRWYQKMVTNSRLVFFSVVVEQF
jgi:hypothetical protein